MEGPKDWSLIWPQATIIIKSTVVAPPFHSSKRGHISIMNESGRMRTNGPCHYSLIHRIISLGMIGLGGSSHLNSSLSVDVESVCDIIFP